MTAKIVIASAARLIEVRHFCRNRKRMALISVPAWPIPTQKTTPVMAQAQLTVVMMPQMPVPFQTRRTSDPKRIIATLSVNARASFQGPGVLASTIPETCFVIPRKSRFPGSSSARIAGSSWR